MFDVSLWIFAIIGALAFIAIAGQIFRHWVTSICHQIVLEEQMKRQKIEGEKALERAVQNEKRIHEAQERANKMLSAFMRLRASSLCYGDEPPGFENEDDYDLDEEIRERLDHSTLSPRDEQLLMELGDDTLKGWKPGEESDE